ncbi:glucuronosyltransferase [Nesidiocoris tenuis]|uniref:UDP-glucuronosyltransferase n=1 Tax=Nesidiocoris tenuis TaxID=355587 RepID=A0ABN7BEM1_9HEMI|nr:glucuronosyltransferase [Nesidiocoris tenuis]
MNKLGAGALFILLGCVHISVSLNILVFSPIPWRSHQFVFKQLVRALGSKGHNVDFYTMLPMKDPPATVKQIVIKDSLAEGLSSFDVKEFVECGAVRNVEMTYEVTEFMLKLVMTSGSEFQNLLNTNRTYDITIIEPNFAEAQIYLSHRFNSKTVMLVSMLDHSFVRLLSGLPDNPTYVLSYQSRTNNKLDFTQRLANVVRTSLSDLAAYWYTSGRMQTFADTYIRYDGWENRPKITDMISDTALILVNSHPSISYPIPLSPHVKEIGGIHVTPPQPLPKDLQEFMDGAPNGVIYFSLGTNLDAKAIMENGLYDVFINTFKKFNRRVMWKANDGMKLYNDHQIKMQTWYPQQDVLAHPNCHLFITHGGLQSMVETISKGVPTVAIPFMFDQFKDAEYMASVGMGIHLSSDNITETSLGWAINEVLTNNQYRENAQKRSSLFKDRPMSPADEAVYWIEYVARHGQVLQPASVRMPFYQLFMLDILATLAALIAIAAILIRQAWKAACSCENRKEPTEEQRAKYRRLKSKKL